MQSFTIKLDFRIVSAMLTVVILVMLGFWQPWSAAASAKTISVSGTASIKALPDQYVFSPTYEAKGATEKEALASATNQTTTITVALKALGVPDKDIATASSATGNYYPYWKWNAGSKTATTSLTVTVDNKDLAEKVQTYLLTTDLTGSASPQASFSETRRKALEAEARTKAIDDAKAKATQIATELGVHVGKAQSVDTNNGYGEIMPLASGKAVAQDANGGGPVTAPAPVIYTGQNDISASVAIVYALR